MEHNEHISPKLKRKVFFLLILLIIIGGFVLYGSPKEEKKPRYQTAPLVKGPTTPPPHTNEVTR